MWKTYKAEYEDENFEIIMANNDLDVMTEAENYESEHGTLFNIFEVDENYNEVSTVF